MIDKLISFALKQRAGILMLMIGVIALGMHSIFTIPTDSFPDVSNISVEIITEPESMAAEEVESLVTVPIEYALSGVPFIKKVRSSSEFGLSVVTAIFDDQCDLYLARQLVQQRLSTLQFPPGVPAPQLGPAISTFSQVFMYYVTSDHLNLIDLRTLQDWTIAKRLLATQGVVNVVSYGGFVKQYQVLIDPNRLKSYELNLADIEKALEKGNLNIGGNFIEQSGEEVIIRGLGRVKSVSDIQGIVLKEVHGTPVKVQDVAKVVIGPAFRRGSASMNAEGEAVIGIVFSRKGVNTKEVVANVEKKLEEIQKTLPPGVRVTPYYNQKELVDRTTDTVKEILLLSSGLVIVVLTAILLDIKATLIVCVIIPLSLLFSFALLKFTGLSSNLMTMGAVDFGVVVDAGVVMVENIYRKLAEEESLNSKNRLEIVTTAAQEVGRPITFAICIIIAVYLPLFTLEGIEAKMFEPLALTFIYALLGALLVSLTIIPVICFWMLKGKVKEKNNPVMNWLKNRYVPLLQWSLLRPGKLFLISLGCLIASAILLPFLGSEFIPSLDEGSIWLRVRMPPSIAHTESQKITKDIERIIKRFPEVTIVVTRIGRSGMGSDKEGVDAADMYLGLKPKSEWKAKNKNQLIEDLAREVGKIPGVMYSFSQPIADMIDDLITGVKADVGIKIFGDDLETIDKLSNEMMTALRTVPGTGDMLREPVLGLPEFRITLRRSTIARYGATSADILRFVQTATAGRVVSEVIEGNKRFGILIRFMPQYRQTEERLREMLVETPDGARIPLQELADVGIAKGAVLIKREDGQRRGAVMVNVRGRDLGSWVQAAQKTAKQKLKLPDGYHIVWGGQFENQQRAMGRLSIVVPIVLFLIFILLFFTFNSLKNAALIMLTVPFAAIGGVVGLWISHQPLSVPALIGFIALFGVAVQNGVIMISYIMQLQKKENKVLEDAIVEGASIRLRPVVMTVMVAMMGLLPKLFSESTGAEIQRPLATVVFGGLVSATLLTLLVIPSLYRFLNRKAS
ncbi:MAG: CusA/CzcA family heavy metal efflux RND transporter [Candidatus Melainabacteria bacterium]|nr:CusA/CzcA family heavy metal efflux RND transporter [Candidatus Melainabacteria bacterium]